MRNCTKNVTLYHFQLDLSTGYDTIMRYYIPNVSLFGQYGAAADKNGFTAEDTFTLRIPAARGDFPIREGDIVIEGEVLEAERATSYLESNYKCLHVVSCTDNTGKHAPHYKVVCR